MSDTPITDASEYQLISNARKAMVVDAKIMRKMERGLKRTRAMNEPFELRDIVEWESQSRGHYGKKKRGKIVQIVRAGETPFLVGPVLGALKSIGAGFGMSRRHDSYLVNVGGVAYWPRVKHLRLVSKGAV